MVGFRHRVTKLLPPLLVVLAPVAMLWPIWLAPVSQAADDALYYFPLRTLAGQAIRAELFGEPVIADWSLAKIMADPQAALMSPLTWLFAYVEASLAYSLSIFAAFSAAGVGVYLYLRRIGLVRPAATFGAIAFAFCGFMIGHRQHLSLIQTACFLPWGLWAIELLRKRSGPGFLALAAIGCLSAVSGHWPALIHLVLIWFVYLLIRGRPLGKSLAIGSLAGLLVLGVAAPQLSATLQIISEATRSEIGYFTVGENSYFPPAAGMMLFPFMMGSAVTNEIAATWWGPWNFSEMFGYVGLVTLVLAGAALWKLCRGGPEDILTVTGEPIRKFVRLWSCLGIGAIIWMLGYYLPTFRLIYHLPVLGMVRCPARMILLLDMALASLAAMGIHAVISGSHSSEPEASVKTLGKTIWRAGAWVLPGVMLSLLAVTAIVGWSVKSIWPGGLPFPMNGQVADMLSAVNPGEPAIWTAFIVAVCTIVALKYWLGRPSARWPVLVVLLLADLSIPARFVDFPTGGPARIDLQNSPAATWLNEHAPSDEKFTVWGLDDRYGPSPAEYLSPMIGDSLGFQTLNSYGPFQRAAHSQLMGFRIFGYSRQWARLVRQNYLLSLYGVRYLVAGNDKFRDVIESVCIPSEPAVPAAEMGPNLLSDSWQALGCEFTSDGLVEMQTSWLWGKDSAWQNIQLEPSSVYRISLDLRAPAGWTDNYLRAEISPAFWGHQEFDSDRLALMAYPEQIGPQWRHFEWTFDTPARLDPGATLCLVTYAQKPIEVRNISLRKSSWRMPVLIDENAAPGSRVYRKLVELPSSGDVAGVAIYENTLRAATGRYAFIEAGPQRIEALKWKPAEVISSADFALPDISLPTPAGLESLFYKVTLPSIGVYMLVVSIMIWRARREKGKKFKPLCR